MEAIAAYWDTLVFTSWMVYLENRAWFEWASSYVEMISKAWRANLEKQIEELDKNSR